MTSLAFSSPGKITPRVRVPMTRSSPLSIGQGSFSRDLITSRFFISSCVVIGSHDHFRQETFLRAL
jgi:hypothetical protein